MDSNNNDDILDLSDQIDLSPEDVAEFRRLIKEETGADLTEGEARLRAAELIRLVRLLARPPKKEQERTATTKPRSDSEGTLVNALRDLEQSVKLIRPRSKDWAWPVKAAYHLLTVAFITSIEARRATRQPSPTEIASWRTSDLPALLARARQEGMAIPTGADRIVDRLHRLVRELQWITVDTWEVLGDQLPELLRECLDITGALVWEADGLLVASEKAEAKRIAGRVTESLLLYTAKR